MRERYNINNDGSLTLGVAASNASDGSRDAADFICSGAADEATINTAIDSLPASGGSVELSEGLFTLNGPILFDSNVTLRGQGNATTVKLADNARSILAKNKNGSTTNGTDNVGLFDIHFDGNKEVQGYIEDIAIVTAVASTKKFAIAGNRTGNIVAGRTLNIYGGDNHGTFTVVGTAYNNPNTEIQVSQTVANTGASGEMQMGEAYYDYLTGIHSENASGNQGLGTVDFSNVNGLKIGNVKVTNGFPSCIELRTCTEFSITDCVIDGAGDDGIAVNGACYNGSITNNVIKNINIGTEAGNSAGIEIQDGSYNIVCATNVITTTIQESCIASDVHGSGGGNGTDTAPYNLTIANNVLQGGAIKCVGLEGTDIAEKITITGNECSLMYNAVILTDADRCIVSNNSLEGYDSGSASVSMIRIMRCNHISITGNIGSTVHATSSGAMLEFRDVADDIIFSNNLCVSLGVIVMNQIVFTTGYVAGGSAITNFSMIGNRQVDGYNSFHVDDDAVAYSFSGKCALNSFEHSGDFCLYDSGTNIATIALMDGTPFTALSNFPVAVDA